jgi:hypothetical protein
MRVVFYDIVELITVLYLVININVINRKSVEIPYYKLPFCKFGFVLIFLGWNLPTGVDDFFFTSKEKSLPSSRNKIC